MPMIPMASIPRSDLGIIQNQQKPKRVISDCPLDFQGLKRPQKGPSFLPCHPVFSNKFVKSRRRIEIEKQ